MIGYVIPGMLAGLTGGVTHLATGGGALGALGIYAGIGTAGILVMAARVACTPESSSTLMLGEASPHERHLEAQVRAGRTAVPQARMVRRRTTDIPRRQPAARSGART